MNVYLTTGEIVKLYKKFYKLTTQELADKLNKSRSYISLVENNKEKPSKALINDIAEVFSNLYKHDENHNAQYKEHFNLSNDENVQEHLYRKIRDELYIASGFEIPIDENNEDIYKESGRLEENNGENKVLPKPYYDLTWLLEQTENNVYFRFLDHKDSLHIVNITDDDKLHIKSVIEHIFKMKYEKDKPFNKEE